MQYCASSPTIVIEPGYPFPREPDPGFNGDRGFQEVLCRRVIDTRAMQFKPWFHTV